MERFEAEIVSGKKAPYSSWTFIVVPPELIEEWGKSPHVRGTIGGEPYRSTVSRGEGVYRMVVKKDLLARIGASRGQIVEVTMELDTEPRSLAIPEELQAVLDDDAELAERFASGPPSIRRAWATYIGEAKRKETRIRRAEKAPEGIRNKTYPGQ